MANRVDEDDVYAIMQNDLDSSMIGPIEVFITTANTIINSSISDDDELSSDLLTEIEKYLAAHIVWMTKLRQASSVKLGEGEEKYGTLGLNLDATTYGQMVQMLDTSGKLKSAGQKAASIFAVTSFD